MDTFRKALWLARIEMDVSKKHYLTLLIMAGIYTFFFYLSMPPYLEENIFIFDVFLIIYLVTISFSIKPKTFQYQKMDDDLYGSPYFAMLNQLPIKRKVLITSRFILPYMSIVIGMILALTGTYIFSPELQDAVDPLQLIALIVIWICISISIGGLFPASDPGDEIKRFTFFWSFASIIGFFVGLYLIFQVWLDTGFFKWTIYLANEHTLLSIMISIIVACLVTWYWFRHSQKQVKKIDYLQ
ncbi:hypothetical protein [Jeotgalibacillus salarius]|uniref:ABC-2 transporter permease n=1 Tax=Jeotgalibacillus salarius TaxID=546023 RepID=A0A4Y8L9X9_9BACL|nr:hypothetical protein [Jeotgalibacillus salarius]TFD99459.1 hypothetical protein E2626_14465 [Jeotgalibacillus salarius]